MFQFIFKLWFRLLYYFVSCFFLGIFIVWNLYPRTFDNILVVNQTFILLLMFYLLFAVIHGFFSLINKSYMKENIMGTGAFIHAVMLLVSFIGLISIYITLIAGIIALFAELVVYLKLKNQSISGLYETD